MTWAPPTPEEQVLFLRNIQRLLAEGHIAAEDHLSAWVEQNRIHTAELVERLNEASLPHDLASSIRIAEWAYEQTEKCRGQVWLWKDVFRHLGPEWRQLLVA